MMETGLFEIQAEHVTSFRQARLVHPASREVVRMLFPPAKSVRFDRDPVSEGMNGTEAVPGRMPKSGELALDPNADLARCFLRLANLPNYALDRLSRYEATLWRQVGRMLFALDALDRRKPQERRRFPPGESRQELTPFERDGC